MHYFCVFGSSARWIEPSQIQCWGQQRGVVLGLKSPLAKLGGESHLGKLTLHLIRDPHGGGGEDENKVLRQIGLCPLLPHCPRDSLVDGRRPQLAPYSGLELGTRDQLKLPPVSARQNVPPLRKGGKDKKRTAKFSSALLSAPLPLCH